MRGELSKYYIFPAEIDARETTRGSESDRERKRERERKWARKFLSSAITLPSKFGSVLLALNSNTNNLAITKMTQQPCSKFTDNYELKEELGK